MPRLDAFEKVIQLSRDVIEYLLVLPGLAGQEYWHVCVLAMKRMKRSFTQIAATRLRYRDSAVGVIKPTTVVGFGQKMCYIPPPRFFNL